MNKKNSVAATLAIAAMLGFLCTLAYLAVGTVPATNRDFFNMALVALIGFVGTAFGYYLGSSLGSAQKNDLIRSAAAVPAWPPPADQSQAGYILLPLLFLLAAFACIIALTGCAHTSATGVTDTPLQTAGKSLLAVKSTIVTAATATDNLCKAGKLTPDTCAQAKAAYEIARPAYDMAVDAYLLYSTGGDAADYTAALVRVQGIAQNLLLIASGGAK